MKIASNEAVAFANRIWATRHGEGVITKYGRHGDPYYGEMKADLGDGVEIVSSRYATSVLTGGSQIRIGWAKRPIDSAMRASVLSILLRSMGEPCDVEDARFLRPAPFGVALDVMTRSKLAETILQNRLENTVARAVEIAASGATYSSAIEIAPDITASCFTATIRIKSRSELAVWIDGAAVAAFLAWQRGTVLNILERTPSPSPQVSIGGNARLTHIVDLCHRALAIDPDMTDARGTPLRPLVERHIPELIARHRRACSNACVETVQAIDDELDVGIANVQEAVEDAIVRSGDMRLSDLREQLAFLDARHPSRDHLLDRH